MRVLVPLPQADFDPSEVAIPWLLLRNAGIHVDFATADGQRSHADPIMLSGEGLDPWGCIPGLKKIRVLGLMLRADRYARAAYRELLSDADFLHPKRFDELQLQQYSGLLLPGGHSKKMRPYLESPQLQQLVAEFFETLDTHGQHRPVAAVCHGVLVAARTISGKTGRSVLYGKKTTALTWKLEHTAWTLTRYFGRFWDPDYYRTYQEAAHEAAGYWGVEQEVKRALAQDSDFLDVPKSARHYFLKTSGLARDRLNQPAPAWVVNDRNYLSARWPGDIHTLAQHFIDALYHYHPE